MPDFTAAVGLLRKPIEDLYGFASGKLQQKLGQLKAESKVRELHKRLWETQRVKTIWHTDRPLSLTSFFYPVSVRYSSSGPDGVTKLTALDDLPDLHTTIFGTVGQGKSILLKYLLGREIKSGSRVPIFCELRYIGSQGLEDYLLERFSVALGTPKDQELFEFFAKNGKLSFLLDGFDELEPSSVPLVMGQLEDLAIKYETCRITLTSRPDSDCRHLTSFHSVRIEELSSDDLEPFYRRIKVGDPDYTGKLVAAIKASPHKIQQLLKTPLLATLLAISYRAAHRIPVEFAEFYDELFQILLIRHDGSKLGYRRPRSTKLNDREIQQVFEALCFSTRKRKLSAIESDILYELADKSLTACRVSADPTGFLADIKKITCLLLDEGKKTSFVHSSVQEFFAARFIKTRPENVAADFYIKLQSKWESWGEELMFLRQIDRHRALKYFFVPDMESTIRYLWRGQHKFGPSQVQKYLSEMSVNKKTISEKDGTQRSGYYIRRNRNSSTYHLANIDSRAFSALFRYSPDIPNWQAGFEADPMCLSRTYLQIAEDRGTGFYDEFIKIVQGALDELARECSSTKAEVAAAEQIVEFTDID